MAPGIKNARLQEFCQSAAAAADKVQSILDFPKVPLPDEIQNRIAVLRGRLKRPEVRILILGPLKSGKSTLMTVLTSNPRVSQINQLPAYPCVVEVQDVDRDEGAASGETSTFYCDGRTEATIPLKEGLAKLDALLHEYVRQGKGAKVQYDRVVQRIDLCLTQEDLNLVLVDSPGLFFGRKGYSEETRHLLNDSDVVIFVVRPEQLFFQSIKDYLNDFVHYANNRRVFLLVDASTQAKTVKDGKWVTCDQVELKKELLEYFYKHIAERELNAELRTEENISVHFADLYIAAAALLDGDVNCRNADSPGTQGSIDKIQNYIRHEDLAARKERNIRTLFFDIIEDGSQWLGREKDTSTGSIRSLETEIQEQEKILGQYQNLGASFQADLEKISDQSRQVETRLSNLTNNAAHDLDTKTLANDYWRRPTDAAFSETHQDGKIPAPDEEALRQQCAKTYERWKDGKLGTRTLANLAHVIWTEKVLEDRPSLQDQYRGSLNRIYHQALTRVLEKASDKCFHEALLSTEMSGELDDSAGSFSDPVPTLLDFPPVRNFWHWIGYDASDLWGGDGKRVLKATIDDEILDSQQDHFVAQMLHAPWSIKHRLSSPSLSSCAKAQFILRLLPVWKETLKERFGALQREASEVEKRLEDLGAVPR